MVLQLHRCLVLKLDPLSQVEMYKRLALHPLVLMSPLEAFSHPLAWDRLPSPSYALRQPYRAMQRKGILVGLKLWVEQHDGRPEKLVRENHGLLLSVSFSRSLIGSAWIVRKDVTRPGKCRVAVRTL